MADVQNYGNHVRRGTAAEYVIALAFLANFLLAVYRVSQAVTVDRVVNLAVAAALIAMLSAVRRQIVTVQDRVIRNEMRDRMRAVLPPDLYPQAAALPVKQIVALRFASDAELPELVRDVVAGSLTTAKAIKLRVKDWQADYLRC